MTELLRQGRVSAEAKTLVQQVCRDTAVKWKDMDELERALYKAAMDAEWAKRMKLMKLDAVHVVSAGRTRGVKANRILPSRFVFTNKDKGKGEKTVTAGARLCCGGQPDPDLNKLRTDAPTADLLGVNFALVRAASSRWLPESADVRSACELLEVIKGVYGLANAPCLWWRRVRTIVSERDLTELILLPCLFVFRTERGGVDGLVAVHRDDLLMGGSTSLARTQFKKKRREVLEFGEWKQGVFDYTGRNIRQGAETYDVYASQPSNGESQGVVEYDTRRDEEAQLGPASVKQMRGLGGAGGWPARMSRPDISFEVSRCQPALPTATVRDAKDANIMGRRARTISYEIRIRAVDLDKAIVFVSSDASPGTMPRNGSQAGFFGFLADPTVETNVGAVAPLCWSSHRLKRMARSSRAVEAMGVCEGVEAAEYVRCGLVVINEWHTAARNTRLMSATDAQSWYDHVNRDAGMPKDRIFALDVASLKVHFTEEERHASLRWVPGKLLVSDGLAKYLAGNNLMRTVLETGQYG